MNVLMLLLLYFLFQNVIMRMTGFDDAHQGRSGPRLR